LKDYQWNEEGQLIYLPESKVVAEVLVNRKKKVWEAINKVGKPKKSEHTNREAAIKAMNIAFGREVVS